MPKVKDLLAKMRAGKFTRFDIFKGPIKNNKGKEVLAASKPLSQTYLEGLKGCTVCMGWPEEGTVGQIPVRKPH